MRQNLQTTYFLVLYRISHRKNSTEGLLIWVSGNRSQKFKVLVWYNTKKSVRYFQVASFFIHHYDKMQLFLASAKSQTLPPVSSYSTKENIAIRFTGIIFFTVIKSIVNLTFCWLLVLEVMDLPILTGDHKYSSEHRCCPAWLSTKRPE